ncbi:type III-A CRISPR-associated RAMP protein Csm4 [Methanotorris igneus]|nr:type III-A CRISPR-associated RAMP protein Csm4 [Methanotorris igneus]
MQMKAIKLYFQTPLYMGGERGAIIPVHSDTIFGAIINALIYLNVDIEPFVGAFEENRFSISSAFPFRGEKLFFPKPFHINSYINKKIDKDPNLEGYLKLKKFKKKKFFDKENFEKMINGKIPDLDEINYEEKYGYKVADIPKIVLDRITVNSHLYHISQVFFEDNAGLYFLFQGDDEIFKNYIKPAIRLLGDEGIGGKRTWGLGKFKPKFEDIALKTQESDLFVTLSLTIPKNKNVLHLWDFIKRGDWIFTRNGKPRRKPTIMMVKEGSILNKDPGEIIDLDNYGNFSGEIGHKVLVNAKSFLIPVRWKH